MALFPSIRIEGGLLGSDILERVVVADLPGQRTADFGVDARRSLTDEMAAAFADARALWGVFQNRLERLPVDDLATTATRDAWVIPFLGLLGYELRYNPRAHDVDGLTFAVSHRAGETEDSPPVHIVGARQELGRLPPSGRPRLAPHSLVQEYLNRTEYLWGLVTNGQILRLLRNTTFIRRQAYVEFDLAGILEEQRFQDFAALYRLLHRTRLPRGMADAHECCLERYYALSVEQGGRVREHLRDGVEECIKILANGFLRHRANQELRQRVCAQPNAADRISPESLYRQLLRLVYRFLFLLVGEDRGLLSKDPLYRDHYGVARLRRLVDRKAAWTDDEDLWLSLRVLWLVLTKDAPQPALGGKPMASALGLPVLNGELFEPIDLDHCSISNRDLLEAFWYLAYYTERLERGRVGATRRVNYAALDVEELGSVYESLLEYHPSIAPSSGSSQPPTFDLVYGSERRTTGSYYTPPELVGELIKSALEPVLEERVKAARTPQDKERAILRIRVCDPACGSGHFLLAAARRLGKELAKVRTGEDEAAPERVREAIRDVVSHCIYGVDRNPLAVDLCRVALWLEAHTSDKPLTFLDHRIRCGDSLVGVFDLDVLAGGIPDEAFKALEDDDKTTARELKRRNKSERESSLFTFDARAALQSLAERSRQLDAIADESPEAIRRKRDLFKQTHSDHAWLRLRDACHLRTAALFQPLRPGEPIITTGTLIDQLHGRPVAPRLLAAAKAIAYEQCFFHWPLEFPEAFADGGFDAILGNPPFMGGLRISGEFGEKYRNGLTAGLDRFAGNADLCAVFFRRAFQALRPAGRFGMIATNTIGQGDTRAAGLTQIVRNGGVIVFARRFVKWPGQANVEVNLIAVGKNTIWNRPQLDGQAVDTISSRLDDEPEAEPQRISENAGKAFQGSIVLGMGFALEQEEAERLVASDARNRECIRPYLIGSDVNSDPQQRPSRHVICFHDWDLEQARQYPDLIDIVEERVKPERDRLRESIPIQAKRKQFWWQFGSGASELYRAIADLEHVLVRSRVSELHMVVFVPAGWVYGDATVVFAFDDYYHFALLQSNIHEAWVRRNASTMRTDIRYTPTDCFETFAFPQQESYDESRREAERLGEAYHEYRRQIMLARQLGLTKTYNLFHDPACTDADIARLRELHAEMDRAILACYGWSDLDPAHDFHVNERGQTRYTIGPNARREVLRRLLALNLEVAGREAAGEAAPMPQALPATRARVERGRAASYIDLLLRTWAKPVEREALEYALVLMLNDDVRGRVLNRDRSGVVRPSRTPADAAGRFVSGLDAMLGSMAANGLIRVTVRNGRQFVEAATGRGQVERFPDADRRRAQEAIQGLDVLKEHRLRLEDVVEAQGLECSIVEATART